jgi:hypothetical protein
MLGYTTYFLLRKILGPKRASKLRKARWWRFNLSREFIGGIVCLTIISCIIFDALEQNSVLTYSKPILIQQAIASEEVPMEVLIEIKYDWTEERVKQEIKTAADKYGVSYEKMNAVVKCESGYDIDIQSHHILNYGRELSFGLAQWHIPAGNRTAEGKVITKEMALNPIIALDAMAYYFSIGNAKAWTCYRDLYLK